MESPENTPSGAGTLVIYGRDGAPSPELEGSPNTLPPAPTPPMLEEFFPPAWMRQAFLRQEDSSPPQTPPTPPTPPTPLTRAEKEGTRFKKSHKLDIYEIVIEILFAIFLLITNVADYVTGVVLLSFQYVWIFLKVTYLFWSYGPGWLLNLLCLAFFWGAFIPVVAGIIIFIFTYIAEYGFSEGPIQIFREISNQGMDYHIYFATLRNNFLDATEQVDIAKYPFVHRTIKLVLVRSLEFTADICLLGYAMFLRFFFSRCAREEMDGTCAWWFFLDSVFNWDRLKYWFWSEPGTGFFWINRSCPEMNWPWLNEAAFTIHEGMFEGVWGFKGVIWEAFLKPLRWW